MIVQVNHTLVKGSENNKVGLLKIFYEGDGDEGHPHNIVGIKIGNTFFGNGGQNGPPDEHIEERVEKVEKFSCIEI